MKGCYASLPNRQKNSVKELQNTKPEILRLRFSQQNQRLSNGQRNVIRECGL